MKPFILCFSVFTLFTVLCIAVAQTFPLITHWIYRSGIYNGVTHELGEARGLALSDNGDHLYVAAGDTLSVYDVASDGSLSNPRIYRNGTHNDVTHALRKAWRVILSPGKHHLYVTADNTLSVYDVADDGSLSNPRIYRDGTHNGVTHALYGARGLAQSINGEHLYVAAFDGDTLSVYDVAADGSLSNPRVHRNNANSAIQPLDGAWNLTLSPDGKHLYVTAFNGSTLSVYDVASDGSLSGRRTYRDGRYNGAVQRLTFARSVILSPNGKHLYLTTTLSSTLSVYDVGSDGSLSNPRVYRHGTDDGVYHYLLLAGSVVLNPNGKFLYVTAYRALSVYEVGDDGSLSNPRIFRDGTHNGVTHALNRAWDVILSPDGRYAYVTANDGGTLSVYDTASIEYPSESTKADKDSDATNWGLWGSVGAVATVVVGLPITILVILGCFVGKYYYPVIKNLEMSNLGP